MAKNSVPVYMIPANLKRSPGETQRGAVPCVLRNLLIGVSRGMDPRDARKQERIEECRTLIFNHYGWFCACCGSTENLTIDHVNRDGAQHRRELSRKLTLYRWDYRQGFPAEFQTL
jgi:hypothetical protein